jgi:hypothetical protein
MTPILVAGSFGGPCAAIRSRTPRRPTVTIANTFFLGGKHDRGGVDRFVDGAVKFAVLLLHTVLLLTGDLSRMDWGLGCEL